MLTYHSKLIRRMRRYLWKFRVVRLLVFFITGLDLGGPDNNRRLFASVNKKIRSFVWNEVGTHLTLKRLYFSRLLCLKTSAAGLASGGHQLC